MTAFEVLSIVAIAFTSIISVSSILVPVLLSRINNKEQNKRLNIEIYQSAFDRFVEAYGEWRAGTLSNKNLFASVYKIISLCSESTKVILKSLLEEVRKDLPFLHCDEYFYNALDQISIEFKLKMQSA